MYIKVKASSHLMALFFVLVSLAALSACSPTNYSTSSDNDAGFEALSGEPQVAKITETSILTLQSHVSDGTGDMFNGKRRFAGSLGAHGITYNGYQYIVYYEGKNRNLPKSEQFAEVVIARRAVGTLSWERSVLQHYKIRSEDAHNRSTIGISAEDGTIHIAFDHHNQERLNYARTLPGVANQPEQQIWDNGVFTYTPNLGLDDDVGIVTYPSLKSVPGGTVVLYYRDGLSYGGDKRLAYYDSKNSKWDWVRELSTRYGSYLGVEDERGPYLAGGIQVAQDKTLMMSWLWRETSLGCAHRRERVDEKMCNQGVYFAKSTDFGQTWQSATGTKIADLTRNEPISIDTIGGPLIPVPHQARPSNVLNRSVIDPVTGQFHLFLSHLEKPYNDIENRKVYHYQIEPDGAWTGSETSFAARSVELALLGNNLYAFSGRNKTEIFVATREDGFSTWQQIPFSLDADVTDILGIEDIVGGYTTWDLSRLAEGKVSALWHQASPDLKLGIATPLTVIDFTLE
ncbi:BNR-4 repeat-containing protein [Ningiella sp. W23]|uniref:BNR-4 repeat-containing protein n=1 Tax=Ningiella sp. W23 TaxID=3023715 RepID=UPI003757E5E6